MCIRDSSRPSRPQKWIRLEILVILVVSRGLYDENKSISWQICCCNGVVFWSSQDFYMEQHPERIIKFLLPYVYIHICIDTNKPPLPPPPARTSLPFPYSLSPHSPFISSGSPCTNSWRSVTFINSYGCSSHQLWPSPPSSIHTIVANRYFPPRDWSGRTRGW